MNAYAPRQWQYSLRTFLLVVVLLAVLLGIAIRLPHQAMFIGLMTGLLLTPLVIAQVLLLPWVLLRRRNAAASPPETGVRHIAGQMRFVLRWLGLSHATDEPSLAVGAAVAAVSMITLIGLWPAVREFGLAFSMLSAHLNEAAWRYLQDIYSMVADQELWTRLWSWELWAVGRWWLLFGTLTLLWLTISLVRSREARMPHMLNTLARLLAFAPWLIVLEMTFLIGVWLHSSNTVPEPSTGFVVGIFSWDLWHWDCWLNREWLIRGAVPTMVVGYMFFTQVLRWRWPLAVVAAVLLVPVALWLSIAGTVAFSHGLPPLFS